jgi:hypothetical protein
MKPQPIEQEHNGFVDALDAILRRAQNHETTIVKPFHVTDADARTLAHRHRMQYCRRPEGLMVFWRLDPPIWFKATMQGLTMLPEAQQEPHRVQTYPNTDKFHY